MGRVILPALSGLASGLSLIVAIGAQNAFVLRHGLQRSHVALVVAVCAVSDLVLIVLGVVLWLWPDGEEPTQAAPAPAATAEPVAGGEILPRFPLDPSPGGGADDFEAIGERQVAGQACRAWRGRSVDGEIEQCLWSGGRSFGFNDQAVGEGCSPARPVEASLESIVLAQEPVDGKGCRIRTRTFTVGDALDRDAYAPPPAGAGA